MTNEPGPTALSSRWLQTFQVLLILFLVMATLGCVLLLGALVVQLVSGYSMPISFKIDRTIGDPSALPPGLELTGPSAIMINDPTLGQSALRTASLVLALIMAIIVAGYLVRAVQAAIARVPFSRENLRRIRAIGLVLLISGLAASPISMVSQWLIAWISLGDGAGSPMFTEPPVFALAGVVILAVAEVMRQGAALRAELNEVI